MIPQSDDPFEAYSKIHPEQTRRSFQIRALACHEAVERMTWCSKNGAGRAAHLEMAEQAMRAFAGLEAFCLEHDLPACWDQWSETGALVRLVRDGLLGETKLN